MEKFVIGQEVVKIGSAVDYCIGRVGIIIEINEEKNRARVRWARDKNGNPLNVRTWVSFKFLTAKNFF